MSTKQAIGISVLSSLLTLAAVTALLMGGGVAVAQKAEPTQSAVADPDLQPSDLVAPTSGDLMSPAVPEAPDAGMVYMHVAGSTFVPLYKGTAPTYVSGGCTYSASAAASDAHFNFPLMLPPGSKINSLRFYYNDTAATDGTLRIRRMDDGNAFTDVTVVSSVGSDGIGYSSVTGLSNEVDYGNYSYVLQYSANVTGSTMQLCGARVGYTPPGIFGVALPSVRRN